MTKTFKENMNSTINNSHREVLNKLMNAGFQAYIVGGSVRDNFMNIETNDVDITTSATPQEIAEVFKGYKMLEVGNNYGTVPVLIKGESIEITTFRHDSEYSDGRRPDKVTFSVNLEDDIIRRDFTINAIAYNEASGLVDLENGIKDIENKLIRAVGNPNERIKEDPLRILRGLRFASKLGFDIEAETEKAMFDNKDLLVNVSGERIQKEFNGVLQGQNVRDVLVRYAEIIAAAIPSIAPMIKFDQRNPNHIYDVWEHSAVVVQNAKDDIAHKIAGVFHDAGKPSTFTFDEEKNVGRFFGHAEESVKIADEALRKLKYPNKIRERVLDIIIDHDETLSTKAYKVKAGVFSKGPERFKDMIDFKRADDSAKNPMKTASYSNYDKIEMIANEYMANNPILSHKDLEIRAEDVVALGYKGKEIKEVLHKLCLQVIGGHKNDREFQIEHLKKHGI